MKTRGYPVRTLGACSRGNISSGTQETCSSAAVSPGPCCDVIHGTPPLASFSSLDTGSQNRFSTGFTLIP